MHLLACPSVTRTVLSVSPGFLFTSSLLLSMDAIAPTDPTGQGKVSRTLSPSFLRVTPEMGSRFATRTQSPTMPTVPAVMTGVTNPDSPGGMRKVILSSSEATGTSSVVHDSMSFMGVMRPGNSWRTAEKNSLTGDSELHSAV